MEAKIRLRKCGIDALNMTCNHEALNKSNQELTVDIDVRHRLSGSWSAGIAKVTLICVIQIKDKQEDEPDPLCEISVEYFGDFEFKLDSEVLEEDEQEEIINLLKFNGSAIVFPYLRSTISSLSMSAGLNPIVLPTINVVALLKKADSQVDFDA